jgi:hypothetical protein
MAAGTVPYVQIVSVQPRDKKFGVPMILRINLDFQQIAVRELLATDQGSFDHQRYHHEALLLILGRRTSSESGTAADRA